MTHSALASVGATLELLKRHGLYTRKSLGQHFLIDDNVVGKILDLGAISPDDVVLEVGPGIGTLTVALCSRAASVVCVEADLSLLPVLAQTTADCACAVRVVAGDAVSVALSELETAEGAPSCMVANLPYAVAATVVLRFFEQMESMRFSCVMVQSEVADRMTASPGTKAYGSYTVKLRLLAQPAGRFKVAAGSFLPPPRVESAVVRLERRPGVSAADPAIRSAMAAADASFRERRKTLRNSLTSALGAPSSEVEDALRAAGIDATLRAETLEPEAFVVLGQALREAGLLR